MAAAKLPIVKTSNDLRTWKLTPFGMYSRYDKQSTRFVSRTEVAKMLEASISQAFDGSETYGKHFYPRNGTFTFSVHSDGSVSFGCQTFSKAAVKQLKKWAGVR